MSAIGLRRLGSIVAAFVLQTALLRAALPGPDEATHNPISMARMDRLFGVDDGGARREPDRVGGAGGG